MNYIRHLNAFFLAIKKDDRLTSSHVSLYLALFQYWNYNRFQNPFPIYRDNIMQLSKIGSKNTYHKCIKELDSYQYLVYHSAARGQPIKISLIRLDLKKPVTNYQQLDLFQSGTKSGTQPVSELTNASTDIDTQPVSKSVHSIKPNILKTVSNRHSQRNKKETGEATSNHTPHVPDSVHANQPHVTYHPEPVEGSVFPAIDQVKTYFMQSDQSSIEGEKFYNHYKSLGWKISNQPIHDWQALANKWMLNSRHCEAHPKQSPEPHQDLNKDVAYLEQRYKEGHNIFNQISIDHFNHLNLRLTPEVKTEAVKRRIESLIGSNHHSVNQLLQAYQEGNTNSPYILKDQANLVLLAQRIAVINYFNSQANKES